jgi:hypothetical protein
MKHLDRFISPATVKARPAPAASRTAGSLAVAAGLAAMLLALPAHADRIENGVAVFAALDKVTARIKELEVPLNETVEFGALNITPRVCYSRPATERPKTSTFVEVTETELDGEQKKLFTGWMFAESPALNAVEHPVFDVWLAECRQPVGSTASADNGGRSAGEAGATQPPARPRPVRRRIRR